MKEKEPNIVVVEDDKINLLTIQHILGKEYSNVNYFENGGFAHKFIIENSPDIILLDVVIPGIDGFTLCEILKKSKSTFNIPIIFITSKTDKDSIKKGFDLGAQDYVTKPFNGTELLARIRTHLKLKFQQQKLVRLNVELEKLVASRTIKLGNTMNKLEKAQERLSNLEKAKNDFLHLISHELRTPLNSILGFSNVLQKAITDRQHREFLSSIISSGKTLNRLSEIAILIASLQTEKYDLRIEWVLLNRMCDFHIKNFTNQNPKWKSRINFIPYTEEIKLETDSSLLNFCWQEIFHNTTKYISEKDTITVAVFHENNKKGVEIKDTGKGFPENILKTPFELFHIENINYHSTGHGLGLPAIKLIMDYLGGEVGIKNNEEGGANVKIMFPDEIKKPQVRT